MENYCNAMCPHLKKGKYCNDCLVKAWMNNQLTAYDVDKVVEQLESLKTINVDMGFGTTVSTLRKDIVMEVVKGGGVDGN